jgi:hypothetical protein
LRRFLMVDTLEVIKFRDVVRVTAIPRFVTRTPLTVELNGDDFSAAETVLINDAAVPEFIIVNKNTIYAQLPANIQTVRTLQVVSSNFTRTAEASRIDYKIGTTTKKISGILKLTQLFIRWLLTSPGSDVFNQESGGGLQDVAAIVSNTGRSEPVQAATVRAVSLTSEQIRRSQLSTPGLPLDERLLAATVLDLGSIRTTDEVRVRIRLESVAGEDAIAALVL